MKVCALVFMVMISFSACNSTDGADDSELRVMRELVLLRTEGLALAEFVQSKANDPKILAMSENLRAYYQQTHPEFLQICAGRKITLNEGDFEMLWTKISERFSLGDGSLEDTCLQLCEENISSSIKLYEEIIRKRDWEDISYFSFLALPDLYNQQNNLQKLKITPQTNHLQTSL